MAPKAPIHRDLAAGELCAAPLRNPVPMRRLILSYPTDRPIPRLARFSGQIIASNVALMVEQGVWSGRLAPQEPAKEQRGNRRKPDKIPL